MSRSSKFAKVSAVALIQIIWASVGHAADTNYQLKPISLPGATGAVALDYFAYDRATGKLWVPASDTEKYMRGQDLKPGTKAVVGDSWAHHLEQSARNLSGQSHDGVEAPPHLRAERMRTTAADLREKAHGGDSTRDHLARSYERLEASQKGPDAVAQYDTTRSVTLEAARNLDSFADREEADQ